MREPICRQNINILTYKTAFQPTGLDGIVAVLGGYDAS